MKKILIFFSLIFLLASCSDNKKERTFTNEKNTIINKEQSKHENEMKLKLNQYTKVKLTTDLSKLSEDEKQMIKHLMKAVSYMDDIFWQQTYGNKQDLMRKIDEDLTKQYVEINYGPWDRMDDNKSFVDGIGEKFSGANYYPKDMSKEEFEKADIKDKKSLYTLIRRNEKGQLYSIPFHKAYKKYNEMASAELLEASKYAKDQMFKKYLLARSKALLNDDYRSSDMLWMEMKNNHIDVVIGPIETYEDQLFGYKAANEGYVLVKDMEWSKKLARYVKFLPELQKNLPVEKAYKQEKPGARSDLNAYDAIYYAGEANTGGKTIAINLPNDEQVQLKKGTRRLQLKNVMKAKFEKILVPIANLIIDPSQRKYIKFDAFFANTMFHEVAHGLGIKNTINGKGMVRTALKEHYSAIEEGKADILGLYMVDQLHKKGELGGDMKDYMTTFMASIFRSIRFGAADSHGIANMIRFYYFEEKGAFVRNDDGTYKVNYDKMYEAMKDLSALILKLQGDGDYDAVAKLVKEKVL